MALVSLTVREGGRAQLAGRREKGGRSAGREKGRRELSGKGNWENLMVGGLRGVS